MTRPRAKTSKPHALADMSRTIRLGRKDGETDEQAMAEMVVRGTVANASTVIDYTRHRHAQLSLTDIALALKDQGAAVNNGDLASLERMLNGQAVALNAMFTELARRGALNMGEHLDATDRYVRLALKAQSQARATVETLAAIKNPPVVFARQANINNGGQQQVNNGQAEGARAGEIPFGPNELFADVTHGSTQLDGRATAIAGRAHQSLEAVGRIDRPAKP